MMTSDMTPDANGNFKRHSVDIPLKIAVFSKEINNRNSKTVEEPKLKTYYKENMINKQNFFDKQDNDYLKDAKTRICKHISIIW